MAGITVIGPREALPGYTPAPRAVPAAEIPPYTDEHVTAIVDVLADRSRHGWDRPAIEAKVRTHLDAAIAEGWTVDDTSYDPELAGRMLDRLVASTREGDEFGRRFALGHVYLFLNTALRALNELEG